VILASQKNVAAVQGGKLLTSPFTEQLASGEIVLLFARS
jgi:hypothetical protein